MLTRLGRRFGLRLPISAVVGIVNLVALVLPVIGLLALGLLQSELIRQTEAALLAQGSMIAATYDATLDQHLQQRVRPDAPFGRPITKPDQILRDAAAEQARREQARAAGEQVSDRPILTPRLPGLTLTFGSVLPRPEDTGPAGRPPNALAAKAGETVQPLILEAHRSALAAVRVLDADGIAVASTGEGLGHDYSIWPEVQSALSGSAASSLRDRRAQADELPLEPLSRTTLYRVFVALPVIRDGQVRGAVVLSRTPQNLSRILYEKRWPLFVLGVGILVFMALLVGLTSGLISRPLKVVAQQAERATKGARRGIEPVQAPMTREVAALSDSLVTMSRTLAAREKTIRDFARQVSHELKTPIANITGATELLADDMDEMSEADRARFLTNIQTNAAKMQQLVTDLLALARAEAGPAEEAQSQDVGHVVGTAITAAKSFDILPFDTPDLSHVQGQTRLSASLLESVLLALLENSRTHGGHDVSAGMQVLTDTQTGQLHLIYSDTGPGLLPEVAETALKPFVTTAGASGQTGLGLAIVAAIIEAHNGTISLPTDTDGFVARISLPIEL
ncbi:MAG: ATP-binding protein [Alphaproteobacteria bacterium]